MRAVVVYESMFGNTHRIAEAIGDGMTGIVATTVVSVSGATASVLAGADMIVVGGPTHVHSMSVARTRAEAPRMAADSNGRLHLDADSAGPGLSEWIDSLTDTGAMIAAFDTRMDMPRLLTGAASSRIDRMLRRRGFRSVASPMSFLVDNTTTLESSALAQAHTWGASLAHEARAVGTAPASAQP